MKLSLDKIRLDGGTQPRAEVSLDTVAEYAAAMKEGAEFPPVVVFYDGTTYWLADGFHRMRAWSQAFPGDPIHAEIHQGAQADAQWFSYSANKEHDTVGTRRKSGDIRRAAKAALQHPNGVKLSNEQIAEHVGCHETTVRRARAELESTSSVTKSPTRTGKDGRTINTANIGKSRKTKESQAGKISPKALMPVRGHDKPCPMIPLQFSPRSASSAAATLWQLFPRTFIEQLVELLSTRLSSGENA